MLWITATINLQLTFLFTSQKVSQRWRPAPSRSGTGGALPQAVVTNLMGRDLSEADYDLLLQLDEYVYVSQYLTHFDLCRYFNKISFYLQYWERRRKHIQARYGVKYIPIQIHYIMSNTITCTKKIQVHVLLNLNIHVLIDQIKYF